jgi:uncharacterized membrane protein
MAKAVCLHGLEHTMKRTVFSILIFVILSAAAPGARGDGFEYSAGVFTAISVSGAASSTAPTGINDAGQIVGTSANGGFLDNGGVYTATTIPGLTLNAMVDPAGINDVGQIVGSLTYSSNSNPGYLSAGFVYSGTLLTTIVVTPPYETYANGINNLGQVVGISCAAPSGSTSGPCQGFLDNGGVLTAVNVPGATAGTVANGINDSGQIVGAYGTASGGFGFIDTGGIFTTISVPGAASTVANGINDAGQVVGYYCNAFGQCQGFLDTGGAFTSLSVPGSSETYAYGINDAGQIVGYDFPIPAPEPATLAMLAAGVVGLFGMGWLREQSTDPFLRPKSLK